MDKEKEIEGKPLTIEQLKSLEVGDWLWVIIEQKDAEPMYGYFQKTADIDTSIFLDGRYVKQYFDYSDYGTKWLAYKNKEEAENAGYGNIEQAVREFAEELKEIFKTKHAAVMANVACCRIDELIKEKFGEDKK